MQNAVNTQRNPVGTRVFGLLVYWARRPLGPLFFGFGFIGLWGFRFIGLWGYRFIGLFVLHFTCLGIRFIGVFGVCVSVDCDCRSLPRVCVCV